MVSHVMFGFPCLFNHTFAQIYAYILHFAYNTPVVCIIMSYAFDLSDFRLCVSNVTYSRTENVYSNNTSKSSFM